MLGVALKGKKRKIVRKNNELEIHGKNDQVRALEWL
jgi:hypothetical protein